MRAQGMLLIDNVVSTDAYIHDLLNYDTYDGYKTVIYLLCVFNNWIAD